MPNTLDTAVRIESTRRRPPVGANQPDAWTVYDALGNRVATKINDVWQLMVYDAFGKLVAEYGVPAEGAGGVKYIQQDWQGSVRAVANSNGHVVAWTDHQAFGEEIGVGVGLRKIEQGYSVDKATRQGYGLTENDESSGQQHTWFRKLETQAGRWTSPDRYKGSMQLGDPQSFNRYSYVENQPTNYDDPSGLQLRYYDVYRGLACVVDENGVNRCIQYIDRYWYDDGASPWDTPDPTGGWEGPGGGENGGQFDCPNPQSPEAGPSITAAGALQHYIGGTGKDLNMDIKELSAEVPNLFAFPAISARIARGTSKPFEQVSIVRATTGVIRTTGDQAAFLGRITFNVTGVLNLYMTGDFQFYGSIGVNQDLYDFDKDQATGNNRRTPAGQSSTRIGSYIPGKGFNININGRFSLHVSGNPTGITSYSCK